MHLPNSFSTCFSTMASKLPRSSGALLQAPGSVESNVGSKENSLPSCNSVAMLLARSSDATVPSFSSASVSVQADVNFWIWPSAASSSWSPAFWSRSRFNNSAFAAFSTAVLSTKAVLSASVACFSLMASSTATCSAVCSLSFSASASLSLFSAPSISDCKPSSTELRTSPTIATTFSWNMCLSSLGTPRLSGRLLSSIVSTGCGKTAASKTALPTTLHC
mmetsp:Transcript_42467/g.98408  ORF Transcript_42467/g.98408 Transcript_42467/m.98408 type:complete len:220 (+) Transcript_42467:553-1212(+)